MDDGAPRIDEHCRRRFEAHRLAGGGGPLEDFLPPPGSPARDDTLEELVLIELEFRWKAWDAQGEPPSVEDLLAAHRCLGAGAVRRIRDEAQLLRGRFARRQPVGPGVRIGRYSLKERVGRGASAEVWRAVDEELHRDVAVKLAREELVGDEVVTARLLREARSTAQLRHPAIVPVHEVSTRDGQPFIVSDFIDGPTLAQEIGRRRFSPDESAAIVAQLADALDYAHACGIVHRDVKPGNVLLPEPGRPVLADFGLAHLARAEVGLTRQGDVLGTPAYMAPEQARGDVGAVDGRTDVYALGAVLYELLAGRPPFAGTSAASVLYAVLHRDPEPPGAVGGDVPADLATVCRKAMAREPSRRYGSARELADDLRRYLAHEPVTARPPGPLRRLGLWVRRNPALAATLAGSAVVVMVVAAVAFGRVLEERDRARANLYRALVGEAGARLAARDTDWYERTLASLREAASLEVEQRDVLALRELAARCEGIPDPSFHPVATLPAHGGTVRALEGVPGTALVAGVGAPDEVWVRSADDGDVVASRRLPGDDPRRIAVTAGGSTVLVTGYEGNVRLLGLPGLEDIATHEPGAPVWACAASDTLFAVGLSTGAAELLRHGADGGLEIVGRIAAHEGGVLAVAISRDGSRLATAGEDCALVEWDTSTLAETARHVLDDPARVLVYGSDGALAWAAPENLGAGIRLAGGPFTEEPGMHESGVRDVLFVGPRRFVSASADGGMRAWTAAFEPLAVAEASEGPIVAAALAGADGRIVAAHEDGHLHVWRLAESPCREFFMTPHVVAVHPRDDRIFTGLEILEFRTGGEGARWGETLRVAPAAWHEGQVWGAAVSPDGRLAASSGHWGCVKLIDTATWDLAANLVGEGDLAWVVAFSPDSATLAAGIAGEVVLFDVERRTERARLVGHDQLVSGVVFHPTMPLVVTTSFDGTLRAWDPRDGSLLAILARDVESPNGVCFSPDGARLAVASGDGTVAVWDAAAPGFGHDGAARAAVRRLPGHASAAWGVAFSPDGTLFASCDDRGRAILRDGRDLRILVTLSADVRRGRSVAFGRDNRFLAVGCFNRIAVAWDLTALRRRLSGLGLDW